MSDVTFDNLPDLLTTEDIVQLLRSDVATVRRTIRKHKEILKPFKLGRYTRITKENFETFFKLLQNQTIS